MTTVKPSTSRFRIEVLEERIAPSFWGGFRRPDITMNVITNTNITTNITVSQVAFSNVGISVANNVRIGVL
jgi:hypothetical protein